MGAWGEAQYTINNVLTGVAAISGKADQNTVCSVENGNTSSVAYSVGDLIYHNNTLYKAITAIAAGDTFVVNTNIEATTIEAKINYSAPVIITDDDTTPPSDHSALWVYPS